MLGVRVPSMAGELTALMPHGQKKTKHKTNNIVAKLIMTLKMVHIKKKSKKISKRHFKLDSNYLENGGRRENLGNQNANGEFYGAFLDFAFSLFF